VSVAGWHLPFNAACGLRQRGRGAASLTHDDENVARTSPVGGISGGHGGSSSRDAEGAGQGGRRERAVGVAGDYHLRSTLNVHHAVGRLALQQLRRGAASGAVVAADGCSCRDTRGSCRPVQENGEQPSKGRVGVGGGAGSASARPFEAVNEWYRGVSGLGGGRADQGLGLGGAAEEPIWQMGDQDLQRILMPSRDRNNYPEVHPVVAIHLSHVQPATNRLCGRPTTAPLGPGSGSELSSPAASPSAASNAANGRAGQPARRGTQRPAPQN
jgi:hypothetical protein